MSISFDNFLIARDGILRGEKDKKNIRANVKKISIYEDLRVGI